MRGRGVEVSKTLFYVRSGSRAFFKHALTDLIEKGVLLFFVSHKKNM